MLGGEFPMELSTLPPSIFPDFKKIIERAIAPRSKRYSKAFEMLEDIQEVGAKIIAPTIQSVAQAGEERILLAVTDAAWAVIQPAIAAMKVTGTRCTVAELIQRVSWHVPALTILAYGLL